MPHQCVRCNTFYDDGATEILKGCKCGAKLFFYVKKDKIKQAEEIVEELSEKEKDQIETEVFDIIGYEREEKPVILDLEAIRVLKPGKFEIDLVHLFNKKDPVIFKLEEGKYIIDIPQTFKRRNDLGKNGL